MLRRYLGALVNRAADVFTVAGVFIALAWFLPPVLEPLGREATFPATWLDQALLAAIAAVVALHLGSYRAWRDVARKLDDHQKAVEDRMPAVTLGEGQQDDGSERPRVGERVRSH